ncbi:MAG: TolC family protein [Acidobacteria bacterium]|nr:TolC family protein [Acidobacteriota bacterium]
MSKPALLTLVLANFLTAEVHTLTLRQAIELALKQNPDVLMARLDQQKAQQAVRLARDPFRPRLAVGSGLAYSSGFPLSIEGSAPSIVEARASQFLFNQPQRYLVAQAREHARGAAISASGQAGEAAFRTAVLYVEAEQVARQSISARRQVESFENVERFVRARVAEERELPIAARRAALNLAQARQAAESLAADLEHRERSLAEVLGLGGDDRVRPAEESRIAPPLPVSPESAVASALKESEELRALESKLISTGLELRSYRAARLPRMDLVAQYGLFARFNNYEEFFRKFQRHNGQIGFSFQLPILTGTAAGAQAAQAEAELARLRVQMNAARNRISLATRQAFNLVESARRAAEVARLDLEVAREQVSINLALEQEGRASLQQLEEARVVEHGKWMAFYAAQQRLELARLELLRRTGELVAAIR